MAVKASDQVTLQRLATPTNIRGYYLKQASTLSPPAKPTVHPPPAPWTTSEPAYTEGSTDTLYTVMVSLWGDGTYQYGDVQKSASFEAAKQAYNKAQAAATLAANLQGAIENGLMRAAKASQPPAVGKGLLWAVLDDATGTKLQGLKIANTAGTAWMPYQNIVEELMSVSPSGNIILRDNTVTAGNIVADEAFFAKVATQEFWAKLATVENLVVTSKMLGNEIEGKVFSGGLVRGTKIETDTLTVGPKVENETYSVLWESNFNTGGTGGWFSPTGNSLARVTSPTYEGTGSLRVTGGPLQKRAAIGGINATVSVGDVVGAWVRCTTAGGYAYLAYNQQLGDGTLRYISNSRSLPANTWVYLETSISVPGTVEDLEIIAEDTPSGSTAYIDLVQIKRPQTSIGAARFTISESGAALLTAGGRTIVVEDLIVAALRPPTYGGTASTPAISANGTADVTISIPVVPSGEYVAIAIPQGSKGVVDRLAASITRFSPALGELVVTVKNHTTGSATASGSGLYWALIPRNS